MNARGQVVGGYADQAGGVHGFLFSQGSFRTIDPPGAVVSVARAITASGEVGGWFDDAAGVEHGFTLRGQTYTVFDFPDSIFTDINGLTSSGIVVGEQDSPDGNGHGFIMLPGRRHAQTESEHDDSQGEQDD